MARILVGDIGGTNARLAIHDSGESGIGELRRQEQYPSTDFASLTEVLDRFLLDERTALDAVCLGLPAPVNVGDVFTLPNLAWQIDRLAVQRAVGIDRVWFVNDVQAAAAAIPLLDPDRLSTLQRGIPDRNGNRVMISVGTGLGVAVLTDSGDTFATEAGHATFAPEREEDATLQAALEAEFGHVSWERVASGQALPRIHAIVSGLSGPSPLSGPEIMQGRGRDPLCDRTIDRFLRYLGAAMGNIALTTMAGGGIYLGGGVSSSIDLDNAGPLLDAFRNKGRMSPLLERFPIHLVTEPNMPLRGAARIAIDRLGEPAQNS